MLGDLAWVEGPCKSRRPGHTPALFGRDNLCLARALLTPLFGPVDLIYSCIAGLRFVTNIRYAKVLSDTDQYQLMNNGI
jgi:hypothetical protein